MPFQKSLGPTNDEKSHRMIFMESKQVKKYAQANYPKDYFDSIGHKACSQPKRRQVVKSAVIVIDMVSV